MHVGESTTSLLWVLSANDYDEYDILLCGLSVVLDRVAALSY